MIDLKSARSVLSLFLLVFFTGAAYPETLTLATYYPAPYGGYVTLLATQNAFMARDGGSLEIGPHTPGGIPSAKLDLYGDYRIRNMITIPAKPAITLGSRVLKPAEPEQVKEVSVLYVNNNGTVLVGTELPKSPAPNGSNSNVEVNDVYQQGLGAWLSDVQKVQVHLGYAKYHTVGGFDKSLTNYWGQRSSDHEFVTFSCPKIGGVDGIIVAAGGLARDTDAFGNPQGEYFGVPIDYNADRESMYLRSPIMSGLLGALGGPQIFYWYVCVPNRDNVTVLDHR
ncbi:MAG: hypothetical protein A2234_00765 [Elusimicrobia bacterium RIFOXYA2_FULL_58_8]|nr:MAG: hypothetical protein A2285_06115 [Elusimicrobia bacterium RIFOXYA12_FULL_57_11]OGS12210.1 MAG: hypothetical protein A2234_00765 [Elusimicrobia bacterium RIFOXYA2_FULL_58_8]